MSTSFQAHKAMQGLSAADVRAVVEQEAHRLSAQAQEALAELARRAAELEDVRRAVMNLPYIPYAIGGTRPEGVETLRALGELRRVLEEAGDEHERTKRELQDLRSDVAAARRVLGTGPDADPRARLKPGLAYPEEVRP